MLSRRYRPSLPSASLLDAQHGLARRPRRCDAAGALLRDSEKAKAGPPIRNRSADPTTYRGLAERHRTFKIREHCRAGGEVFAVLILTGPGAAEPIITALTIRRMRPLRHGSELPWEADCFSGPPSA